MRMAVPTRIVHGTTLVIYGVPLEVTTRCARIRGLRPLLPQPISKRYNATTAVPQRLPQVFKTLHRSLVAVADCQEVSVPQAL
jgi:hypothetical protein